MTASPSMQRPRKQMRWQKLNRKMLKISPSRYANQHHIVFNSNDKNSFFKFFIFFINADMLL